ncbi:MAG: metal ABC transporter ATP-binding protein [Gammaproteobacteria bacterium]|nr:MAG: metal ABC transporter ATP-binding protein [Gammaproteobacteria bacterium]
MQPGGNAVVFKDVAVSLNGISILEQITADVPFNSCTSIIGPNGAGKTTLLLALLGKVRFSGNIYINKTDRGRKPVIGYVPQHINFDRTIPVTVLEFMSMGFQGKPLWLGVNKTSKEKCQRLLADVHAEHLIDRNVGNLSGGELQRVLLALALQNDPDLLVLDEPDTGVDFRGGQIFCELLEELRGKHGFTQIMVSHDLGTITQHSTHIICMNHIVIAQGAPQEVITQEILSSTFGLHMGVIDPDKIKNFYGMHVRSSDSSEVGGS